MTIPWRRGITLHLSEFRCVVWNSACGCKQWLAGWLVGPGMQSACPAQPGGWTWSFYICRRVCVSRLWVVYLQLKGNLVVSKLPHFSGGHSFLPRCMQCRRGLAMRILSVRPSVCHTRALWQNGRKICPDFYTIQKNIYPSFLRRRMVGGERPLLPEILGQPAPVGAKSPILNG